MNQKALITVFAYLKVVASMLTTIMMVTQTGAAQGQGNAPTASTQNVNVVNTPTVNVGTLPAVSLSGTPTVNVGSMPAVNANVTVTAPGPLTNVGRLPSKQVMLFYGGFTLICPSKIGLYDSNQNLTCFDMNAHPGEVLVITDIEWMAFGSPGNTCSVQVGLVMTTLTTAAADGWAGKSEHLTTGIKMTVNPTLIPNCASPNIGIQGYLMPNQ